MPKIFMIDGYQISIWSEENNEPIHVHVSKRRPSPKSTKLWMKRTGEFVRANLKDTRIPDVELNSIIRKLNLSSEYVKNYWIAYHGYEKYID